MGEPLSRVEAILQNILGADNILVPPGSQVEEILQAIYYNTEYEKNPKSRVAEILLAIKNEGIYDGPVLSRMEDILVHKLNDEEYTDYSEDDLSRIEKLLIQWIDLHPEVIKELTTSSFPISILANGLPLIDYIISGNTVQDGTPTPDNPIMPKGTGERTGNLFDSTIYEIVPASTTAQRKGINLGVLPQGTYTLNAVASSSAQIYRTIKNGDTYTFETILTLPYTFTTDGVSEQIIRTASLSGNSWADVGYTSIMLNSGSTALPYEPYGYKIPISSANTTTPVYLGEVQTTRKIKKLVLTGEETSWTVLSPYYTVSADNVRSWLGCICTHCAYNGVIGGNSNTRLWIKQTSFPDYQTLEDFKTYLQQQYAAGTPVTVWYVLATEETAVVNEPLMKIGDYADTLSMEQAGVQIPTLKKPSTTVIDVETSLEPSSMYLKYSEPSNVPTPKTQVLGTKNREIYVTSNNEVYVLRR